MACKILVITLGDLSIHVCIYVTNYRISVRPEDGSIVSPYEFLISKHLIDRTPIP